MHSEAEVDAPRSVAEQVTLAWLDRVEGSVERAHAALLGSERVNLVAFTSEMESACRERSGLTATPAMAPALGELRGRLTVLQAMLRQAAAIAQAREQLETQIFLGYTPGGLERAL
jgi:hypothetical protein